MKHLIRLSDISLILLIFLFFTFNGCSKKEKLKNEIVRIKESVLTEEELNITLGEKVNSAKFREQYINEWIEREVLYYKAIEEGIIKDKEFDIILERSKKELAAAFLLRKILSENMTMPSEDELRAYFLSAKDDFKLQDDLFRVNIIYFNDFDKAVKFRTTLIESDWNKSLNAFGKDPSIISYETGKLYYGYQIHPAVLMRIINFLLPEEVSIVIEIGNKKFAVVQMIEKIEKGNIPPFETVKEVVKSQYEILKNKEFIKNYIQELIDDYDVEIKRD